MAQLADIDIGRADGIAVIGDIHGCADAFAAVVDKATERNLFVVADGDVVGRGDDSPGAMRIACELVEAGRGLVIVGNHDRAFVESYRHRQPACPSASGVIGQIRAHPEGKALAERFAALIEASPCWAKWGQSIFVHAAFDPRMLDVDPLSPPGELRTVAQKGVESGAKDRRGCAIRLHDWVHRIPYGHDVYFGHDVLSTRAPKLLTGAAGGCAYAIDTGCVFHGLLSAAVIRAGASVEYLFARTASPLVRDEIELAS